MNNTFLWHCLLYNATLTKPLNKILQCEYPQGEGGGVLWISRDKDYPNEGKNQTPKKSLELPRKPKKNPRTQN